MCGVWCGVWFVLRVYGVLCVVCRTWVRPRCRRCGVWFIAGLDVLSLTSTYTPLEEHPLDLSRRRVAHSRDLAILS